MDRKGLYRKYDIFSLAGAAAGANEFENWRQTLVDHIITARAIGHPIDRLVILEHRDCGAYKKWFDFDWLNSTPSNENEIHGREVKKIADALNGLELTIDSFLMAREEDDPLVIPA